MLLAFYRQRQVRIVGQASVIVMAYKGIFMKRTALRMFIRGFIQSFFIVAILLGVGILGYKLTVSSWEAQDEDQATYQEETVQESMTKARVDDISKNLIFCYQENSNEITRLVLEIYHCANRELTYLTIPMRTQLVLSDELYRKLVLVNPAMPQVLLLSAVSSYLDADTIFDYSVFIVEELLDLKISYYTAIPEEVYEEMFDSKSVRQTKSKAGEITIKGNEDQLPVEYFQEDYIKRIRKLNTAEDISNYIEEIYPELRSNLTVTDKMKYLESYEKTKLQDITFELIQGEDTNRAFFVDLARTAKRYNEITKNKTLEE